MGIKDKVLTVVTFITSVFAAIFYVLFKQKKVENNIQLKENEKLQSDLKQSEKIAENNAEVVQAVQAQQEAKIKQDAENEELLHKVHSGNGLDSFNASCKLMSDKQS